MRLNVDTSCRRSPELALTIVEDTGFAGIDIYNSGQYKIGFSDSRFRRFRLRRRNQHFASAISKITATAPVCHDIVRNPLTIRKGAISRPHFETRKHTEVKRSTRVMTLSERIQARLSHLRGDSTGTSAIENMNSPSVAESVMETPNSRTDCPIFAVQGMQRKGGQDPKQSRDSI
jgi:hypothetical protein